MLPLALFIFSCAAQAPKIPSDAAIALNNDSPIYTNVDHENLVRKKLDSEFANRINNELLLGSAGLLAMLSKRSTIDLKTPISISCSSFLIGGRVEQDGFGMYSYILFSKRPTTDAQHRRYKKLFRAFSCTLVEFREQYEILTSSGFKLNAMPDKKFINLTYWPLKIHPPEIHLSTHEEYDAFFVENYDYMRSRLILSKLNESNVHGPFIVSYHRPIAVSQDFVLTDEILIIDLSRIDEDLFQDVFDGFRNMVKDGDSWNAMFNFDLIRIHVVSALKIHGKPAIDAAQWMLDFVKVKEAYAGE